MEIVLTPPKQGTYDSSYEAGEPDAHIVDLNTELVQCNEAMAVNLPKKQRRYDKLCDIFHRNLLNTYRYLFTGLNHLMEHMLISSARHLRVPNAFGIKKVLRNILALQQGIKTLTDDSQDADLDHAKEYYNLFFIKPPVGSLAVFLSTYH